MTLFSRKVDYALLVLHHLMDHGGPANARCLAERFDLSRPFVANILKELCGAGLLKSQRGVNGGYALARPPDHITLAQIIEALEGRFRLTACAEPEDDGAPACTLMATCPTKAPLAAVHEQVRRALDTVTLAGLRPGGGARRVGGAGGHSVQHPGAVQLVALPSHE